MEPFRYVLADDLDRALAAGAAPGAQFIAGGTTLVDLMRLEVMRPAAVVDITALPLDAIEAREGALRIGALARNSDVARHPRVVADCPALAQALESGASPQLRNMATVGGNLLQRTRCPYFRDLASACNKRAPGSGCGAIGGVTRSHAILGVSERCIATHPSDMCVALAALDAVVHVRGAGGARVIPLVGFHREPGEHPEVETALAPGELVIAVEVPTGPLATRSRYVKVRDRASYAFALASAAVALDVVDGRVRAARIALGGVATRPWRAEAAERSLVGVAPTPAAFQQAAALALDGARTQPGNAFKVDLARRTIVRAFEELGGAP